LVETPVDTRRDRPPEKKICFRFAKISPSATVQKLFSSTLFFSDFKISSQAQAVSQFPFTALLVVATGAHTQPKATPGKKFAFASRKYSPSATVYS
jgi:hypothetical protein